MAHFCQLRSGRPASIDHSASMNVTLLSCGVSPEGLRPAACVDARSVGFCCRCYVAILMESARPSASTDSSWGSRTALMGWSLPPIRGSVALFFGETSGKDLQTRDDSLNSGRLWGSGPMKSDSGRSGGFSAQSDVSGVGPKRMLDEVDCDYRSEPNGGDENCGRDPV